MNTPLTPGRKSRNLKSDGWLATEAWYDMTTEETATYWKEYENGQSGKLQRLQDSTDLRSVAESAGVAGCIKQ